VADEAPGRSVRRGPRGDVDNDPVVLAHGGALLKNNFRVRMVDADTVTRPPCWTTR
jgi:hypothetical protein